MKIPIKTSRILKFLVLSIAMLAMAAEAAQAADISGSKDHPLLGRYEGSEIVYYDTQAYTQHAFFKAPAKHYGGREKNLDAMLALEGKRTTMVYRAPQDRSPLEVLRNYQSVLTKNGFTAVFECAQDECGGRNFNHAVSHRGYYSALGEYYAQQQYLLAKLQRSEGDIYVALYIVANKGGGGPNKGRSMIQMEVLELSPMENRMVVLKADAMESDLSKAGRVALYGILFDLDKDTMRADSSAQLDEIAKLLKATPALKVLVVGHTDAQGSMEYNRDLSLRRARSIVAALAKNYGIAAGRLTPAGVGMAAPVASNRSEQGRAQNRRVELVDIGS